MMLGVACSKSEPQAPAPASNAAALKLLQEQRDAPPVNQAETVGGDELERMAVFSSLKAPTTPGNPSDLVLCVTLYGKNGRAVSAEGEFDVTSDIGLSPGSYVYAPMFVALDFPGNSSPLGICPASASVWPDALGQLRGKTFPVQVKFTSVSGKTLTAAASLSF